MYRALLLYQHACVCNASESFVGFELLATVDMKSSLWDVMLYSLLKMN
jgi:hypothetical protein